MNYFKYLSLKFSPHGRGPEYVDCWGLAQLFYNEEFGIELPTHLVEYCFDETGKLETSTAEHAIRSYMNSFLVFFEERSTPGYGDILIFTDGLRMSHIGIALDDTKMLNARNTVGICIEKYKNNRLWQHRLYGAFRHVGRISR